MAYMEKITLIALVFVALLLAASCAQNNALSYEKGIKKIQAYDLQYGTAMESVPTTIANITALHQQLLGMKAANDVDPALALLLDYRIAMLDAKIRYEEGWKYGRQGTTVFGFGCSGMYTKVIESSDLRNQSAAKGQVAVEMLQQFIDTNPEKAKTLNLTQRDVLALKTIYFGIQEQAEKDRKTIIFFCQDKVNQTMHNGTETA